MSVHRPTATARPAAGDPLALFAVLADEDPVLGGADEVERMRRAVTAMRRTRRLAAPRRRLPAVADWRRAAAVGVLAVGLLSLAAGGWREVAESGDAAAVAETPAALRGGSGVGSGADFEAGALGLDALGPELAAPAADGDSARRPVFEGLDQPRTASVYELAGEGLDLVMVVDETLDV